MKTKGLRAPNGYWIAYNKNGMWSVGRRGAKKHVDEFATIVGAFQKAQELQVADAHKLQWKKK